VFRPRLEGLEDRCLLSYAINEFPVPAPASAPNRIHAGPDGNVWFLDTGQNTLGRITPTGQVTELAPFPSLPEIGNFGFARDGGTWNIWMSSGTNITEITLQGAVLHDYVIPSMLSRPNPWAGLLLVVGPDSNIWYTEPYNRDLIGRITPDGQITEFPIPGDAFGNYGAAEIISGPDGNLWFESTATANFGRM
jgi:virginiamycin B lyase